MEDARNMEIYTCPVFILPSASIKVGWVVIVVLLSLFWIMHKYTFVIFDFNLLEIGQFT